MPHKGDKNEPIAVKHIASAVTTVDLATGEKAHAAGAWALFPPAKGACQICGRRHPADDPHDPTQIYYQTAFHSQIGRLPTWADAMAHCDTRIRHCWEQACRNAGVWSEPPNGEKPVKHHGIERSTRGGLCDNE